MTFDTEYAGKDIIVTSRRSQRGKPVPLVVSFSSTLVLPGQAVPAYLHKHLGALGVHQAYVNAFSPHAWQTPEMHDAVAAVRAFAVRTEATGILVVGASIGGFGAMLFAPMLGASRVLAFAPQYTVDYRRLDFDTRVLGWAHYRESTKALLAYTDAQGRFPFDDMDASLASGIPRYVVFDPAKLDGEHARRFRSACTRLFPLMHASHAVSRFCHELQLLRPLLGAFIKDDAEGMRRTLASARRNRRHSASYRADFLLDWDMAARHPRLTRHAVRQLVQLAPRELATHRALIELLLLGDQPEEAQQAARHAALVVPGAPNEDVLLEQSRQMEARRRALFAPQEIPVAGAGPEVPGRAGHAGIGDSPSPA